MHTSMLGSINQPFIPDLGGWSVCDLRRLASDPAFREQCHRAADPDLALEDSLINTARALAAGHGRRIANSYGKRLHELSISKEDYEEVSAMVDLNKITFADAFPLLVAIDEAKTADGRWEELASRLGLLITGTQDDVSAAVRDLLALEPKAAQDYRNGKLSAIGS